MKKSRRLASTIPELSEEIDATQRSVANLRTDISNIVWDTLSQFFSERDKARRYVEIGYR